MSRLDAASERVRTELQNRELSDRKLIGLSMLGIYLLYLLFGFSLGYDLNGQVNALQRITFLTAVFGMAGLALNLHWGYTGLFNVGIAGFVAVGVYVMGMATAPSDPAAASAVPGLGLPMPIGIILGVLAASLAGLIVSLPALRLQADYLAIVTLGFSEIVRLSVSSSTLQQFNIGGATVGTGGSTGLSIAGDPSEPVRQFYETGFGIGPLSAVADAILSIFEGAGITEPVVINLTYTLIIVGVLALVYIGFDRLVNSPFGRALKATKEDQDVASALGKNTQLLKVKSLVIGCGLLGLVGIIWQGSRGLVTPGSFMIELTVFVWIVVIIGGAGSNTGTIIGAAAFVGLLNEGPTFVKNVIEGAFEVPRAPSSIGQAIGSLGSGDPLPLVSYILTQLPALQFVLLGTVLVVIVQRRPQGIMGHRKEPSSTIDLQNTGPDSKTDSTADSDQ